MSRLFGILKVALVLAIDFAAIYSLFDGPDIASGAVGVIALYVLFGGYLTLLKEGAVSSKKLLHTKETGWKPQRCSWLLMSNPSVALIFQG